jgi:hypothetical protein
VETYLFQEEPGDVTIPTAEAYYATMYLEFTDPRAVEERGVEAGVWLGQEPVGQVAAAIARTRAAIEKEPVDRLLSIGGMGIRLNSWCTQSTCRGRPDWLTRCRWQRSRRPRPSPPGLPCSADPARTC